MSKVTIENHNGRLRLRWRYQGKRYTLAISVANNVMGQAIAKQKASQIEVDMQAGYFDLSLLKYKPRILGKTATEVTAPELFERYTRVIAKDKALCNGSLERYRGCSAHIKRSLNIPAHQVTPNHAANFTAVMLESVSNSTAKAYLC